MKIVKVKEVLRKIHRPGKIPASEYLSAGAYPVIDQGQNIIAGYTNDEDAVIFEPLPMVVFGDHTRAVKFSKVPFATGADGTQLVYPVEGIDPTFFYYAIKNVDLSNYFYARHFKYLKEAEITIPDTIEEQRRIADILSAYDDKIANNRRRMELLEESARLVYRKMFGDGVSGTSGTKWDVKPLSEVADVLYGKDHKKLGDGQIPCYGSGGIMRYCDAAIYDRPSVLIPRKGSIGNVMFVDEPFWSVDTMFYTRVKISDMEHLLYYQLCDYNLASMSTGAAVPSMTTALLNPLEIVVPPEELRVRYSQLVQPMFDQKRQLSRQNAKLASARDILLPQLMSGRLRIDATACRGKKVVS